MSDAAQRRPTSAAIPRDLLDALADQFGTRQQVLFLCELVGQRPADIPNVEEPRQLWTELWRKARDGAVDFRGLVEAANEEEADQALARWLAATPEEERVDGTPARARARPLQEEYEIVASRWRAAFAEHAKTVSRRNAARLIGPGAFDVGAQGFVTLAVQRGRRERAAAGRAGLVDIEEGRTERTEKVMAAAFLNDVVQARRRVLLIGDGGSGKSTLLDYFTWLIGSGGAVVAHPHLRGRLPLHIHAQDLVGRDGESTLAGAYRVALERVAADLDKPLDLPASMLGRALDRGDVVLLVDGLDEVHGAARLRLQGRIELLLERFTLPVVLASRDTGLEIFNGCDLERARIEPLSRREQAAMIRAYVPDEKESERIGARLTGRFAVLNRAPLFMALAIYLHKSGHWPERPGDVFVEAARLLLRRQGIASVDAEDVLRFLEDLSLQLLDPRAGARAVVPDDERHAPTDRTLAHLVPELERRKLGAAEAAGILVPFRDGKTFLHRRFQEALAGRALARRHSDRAEILEEVGRRAGALAGLWEEPLAFCMEALGPNADEVDEVVARIASLDGCDDDLVRSRLCLAGRLLKATNTSSPVKDSILDRLADLVAWLPDRFCSALATSSPGRARLLTLRLDYPWPLVRGLAGDDREATRLLEALLTSSEPAARPLLEQFALDQELPVLVRAALGLETASVRVAAAKLVWALPDVDRTLAEVLEDPDRAVRRAAVESLSLVGKTDEELRAIPECQRAALVAWALDELEAGVPSCEETARLLSRLLWHAPVSLPLLNRALKQTTTRDVRVAAVHAIGRRVESSSAPLLIEQVLVNDPDEDVRVAAIRALGAWKGTGLIRPLAVALEDSSLSVVTAAVTQLRSLARNEEARPLIDRALARARQTTCGRLWEATVHTLVARDGADAFQRASGDPDPFVRREFARCLRGDLPGALDLIGRALRDVDSQVRAAAAAGLLFLREESEEAAAPLGNMAIRDPEPLVRRAIIKAVYDNWYGVHALPIIQSALFDTDSDVQQQAVDCLVRWAEARHSFYYGGHGGPCPQRARTRDPSERRAEALVLVGLGLQAASSSTVRRAAALALGKGHWDALDLQELVDRAMADQDDLVRRAAAPALLELPWCTERLERALEDQDEVVRFVAASAISRDRGLRSTALLTRALSDREVSVRLEAAKGLAERPAPTVLTLVRQSLDDPDPRVRAAGASALQGRGGKETLQLAAHAVMDRAPEVAIAGARALSRLEGAGPIIESILEGELPHRDRSLIELLLSNPEAILLAERVFERVLRCISSNLAPVQGDLALLAGAIPALARHPTQRAPALFARSIGTLDVCLAGGHAGDRRDPHPRTLMDEVLSALEALGGPSALAALRLALVSPARDLRERAATRVAAVLAREDARPAVIDVAVPETEELVSAWRLEHVAEVLPLARLSGDRELIAACERALTRGGHVADAERGRRLDEELVELRSARGDDRAILPLVTLAEAALGQNDPQRALAFATKARIIADASQAANDTKSLCELWLARCSAARDDVHATRLHLEAAILLHEDHTLLRIVRTQQLLGLVALHAGDRARARECFEQARSKAGVLYWEISCSCAYCSASDDDHERVDFCTRELAALAAGDSDGPRAASLVALVKLELPGADVSLDELRSMVGQLKRGMFLFEALGERALVGTTLLRLGQLLQDATALEEATGCFERALRLCREHEASNVATCVIALGGTLERRGLHEQATRVMEEHIAKLHEGRHWREEARLLIALAGDHLRRDEVEAEVVCWERAVRAQQRTDDPPGQAVALQGLALALADTPRGPDWAPGLLQRVIELLEPLGEAGAHQAREARETLAILAPGAPALAASRRRVEEYLELLARGATPAFIALTAPERGALDGALRGILDGAPAAPGCGSTLAVALLAVSVGGALGWLAAPAWTGTVMGRSLSAFVGLVLLGGLAFQCLERVITTRRQRWFDTSARERILSLSRQAGLSLPTVIRQVEVTSADPEWLRQRLRELDDSSTAEISQLLRRVDEELPTWWGPVSLVLFAGATLLGLSAGERLGDWVGQIPGAVSLATLSGALLSGLCSMGLLSSVKGLLQTRTFERRLRSDFEAVRTRNGSDYASSIKLLGEHADGKWLARHLELLHDRTLAADLRRLHERIEGSSWGSLLILGFLIFGALGGWGAFRAAASTDVGGTTSVLVAVLCGTVAGLAGLGVARWIMALRARRLLDVPGRLEAMRAAHGVDPREMLRQVGATLPASSILVELAEATFGDSEPLIAPNEGREIR